MGPCPSPVLWRRKTQFPKSSPSSVMIYHNRTLALLCSHRIHLITVICFASSLYPPSSTRQAQELPMEFTGLDWGNRLRHGTPMQQ